MASSLRRSPGDCPPPVGQNLGTALPQGAQAVPGTWRQSTGAACDHEAMDRRALDDLRRLAALDDELGGARAAPAGARRDGAGAARARRGARGVLRGLRRGRASHALRSRVGRAPRSSGVAQRSARRRPALADARDDERRELARRALARAEDHLSVAEIALGRASTDAVAAGAPSGRLAARAAAARRSRAASFQRISATSKHPTRAHLR